MDFKQWLSKNFKSHKGPTPRCYICDGVTHSWCDNCLEYCCKNHREEIAKPVDAKPLYWCDKCMEKAYKSKPKDPEWFKGLDKTAAKNWWHQQAMWKNGP
jgi:hypothetical protein